MHDEGLTGAADGILGPRSRAALRELQRDLGLTADGFLTPELIDSLGLRIGGLAYSCDISGVPDES